MDLIRRNIMKKYDYLIVGSGLFGSVFAHEAKKNNKTCLVIDKRNHIGGNIYTENIEGINVHKYGAHIFHTSNEKVWNYINSFSKFNNYVNSPIANYKGEIYNLPFNMNTFNKLWGVVTPSEAKLKIEQQKQKFGVLKPENLEQQAISLVGIDIYEKLIKGYTQKQWGKKCTELPAFIISRLPVRFTYNNNYFNDVYQGIPIGGYTKIIEKMLEGIDVKLGLDYFEDKEKLDALADKVVFTGMIDQYYNYEFGNLEYRSLKFDTEVINETNYQGNAVVNYTDIEVDYTRVIEHKHFEFGTQDKTVVTKEYPKNWNIGDQPYYPVNDSKNSLLLTKYQDLNKNNPDVIFGGRLGLYKYMDMDDIIESALNSVETNINK
jgi:UDP-galactopyranose mutase